MANHLTPAMEPQEPDSLWAQVRQVLLQARQTAQRSVNQAMMQAYWQVGQLIVHDEQAGHHRAAYGAKTLPRLARRLTQEFGRGFSEASLRSFRQFHQTFTLDEIRYTPCSKLSWSHLQLLMRKLSHQDVGQLDMYVRVFDQQIRQPNDNPTIGLILCSERNEAVARYSLLSGSEQIFASRYQPWLPTEAELQAELTRDRAIVENREKGEP